MCCAYGKTSFTRKQRCHRCSKFDRKPAELNGMVSNWSWIGRTLPGWFRSFSFRQSLWLDVLATIIQHRWRVRHKEWRKLAPLHFAARFYTCKSKSTLQVEQSHYWNVLFSNGVILFSILPNIIRSMCKPSTAGSKQLDCAEQSDCLRTALPRSVGQQPIEERFYAWKYQLEIRYEFSLVPDERFVVCDSTSIFFSVSDSTVSICLISLLDEPGIWQITEFHIVLIQLTVSNFGTKSWFDDELNYESRNYAKA